MCSDADQNWYDSIIVRAALATKIDVGKRRNQFDLVEDLGRILSYFNLCKILTWETLKTKTKFHQKNFLIYFHRVTRKGPQKVFVW